MSAATRAAAPPARVAAPMRGLPQPASVTATPRLQPATGTPLPGLRTPPATGTLTRVISTAVPRDRTPGPAPEGTGTAGGGVPGAAEPGTAAGGIAGGPAATGEVPGTTTDAGTAAPVAGGSADQAPPPGTAATAAPGRTGDSRAVTDRAEAPAGLLSAPAADPGIRRRWAATGSPRAGQSWLARLTADRPGPWGWGLTYPLLGLAFLWAFRRVWQGIGELRETADGRVADGEGRP